MKAWQIYLLQCADGSLYCGITTDLNRRLLEHNGFKGKGAHYTASRRPVTLMASAPCKDRSTALRIEAKIKKLPRNMKYAALLNYNYQNANS